MGLERSEPRPIGQNPRIEPAQVSHESLSSLYVSILVGILRFLFSPGMDTGLASAVASFGGFLLERVSLGKFSFDRSRAIHVALALATGILALAGLIALIWKIAIYIFLATGIPRIEPSPEGWRRRYS